MHRLRSLSCALLFVPLIACAAGGDPADPEVGGGGDNSDCAVDSAMPEADTEFADAIGDLRGENDTADTTGTMVEAGCAGSDESGDFGFIPKPCTLLRPLLAIGDDIKKLGVFVGVEGEGVLGYAGGFAGYDIVFDLAHHQMTVSQYKGAGFSAPGASISGQIYVGAAIGFEHGVADWDGWFVSASGTIDLSKYIPIVGQVSELSFPWQGFLTGVDNDKNNFIGPTEILLPPNGVYGVSIGVKAGVGLDIKDLNPLPFNLEGVSEGYWSPHNAWIRQYYDYLTGGWFPIKARLVDHHDGSACPAGWPQVSPEKGGVIEFGDPGTSHIKRSLHTARALCSMSGGCAIPMTWPVASLAIAVGALNSSGLSLSSFCPAPGGAGGGGH